MRPGAPNPAMVSMYDNIDDLFPTADILETFQGFLNRLASSLKLHQDLLNKGPINNKSPLVGVVDWRCTGGDLLPELMMALFTNVCVWHQASMS